MIVWIYRNGRYYGRRSGWYSMMGFKDLNRVRNLLDSEIKET